ncbi:NAD(P)-binding protein [Hortaea werneckii]|nr:NAD(P)-binding protein [Hortaea werneckii]
MFDFLTGGAWTPEQNIPNLSGKVIIVTGGNAGLGKETVLQLAKHDSKEIFLAARTPSKAEAAISEIKKAVPNGNVSFLQLDLSSFESVKKAAEEFKGKSDRLDILVNNAGIMATPYSKTNEGYEIQFGTNHMGHALFTKLLLPTLLKTAETPGSDVRVVNLSSEGHNMAPNGGILFDQAALEKVGPWARYGQAKLANILHARELQKHHPSLTATALHPGVIVTDLYNPFSSTTFGGGAFKTLMGGMTKAGLLYDVPKGTRNQLWCAAADRETVRSSHYWKPIGSKAAGSKYAQDEKLAERLWEWTEEELKKHGC